MYTSSKPTYSSPHNWRHLASYWELTCPSSEMVGVSSFHCIHLWLWRRDFPAIKCMWLNSAAKHHQILSLLKKTLDFLMFPKHEANHPAKQKKNVRICVNGSKWKLYHGCVMMNNFYIINQQHLAESSSRQMITETETNWFHYFIACTPNLPGSQFVRCWFAFLPNEWVPLLNTYKTFLLLGCDETSNSMV